MSLVGIASIMALVWVAFRNDAWFRKMFGFADFGARDTALLSDAHFAGIIAKSGGGVAAVQSVDRMVHRSTWGVRLLTPVLGAALVYLFVTSNQGFEGVGFLSKNAGMIAVVLLGIYTIAFTWSFRIETDRDVISVMGPAFVMRDYKLADIVKIEEDGPYAWRFHFADGSRPHVMKSVVGAAELRQRLADVLEANARV